MADDVVTETPSGTPAGPVTTEDRSPGVNRVLAWVGVIAGVVFIVGAVFFSGYALGAGSGGFHRWHGGWPGGWPGGWHGGWNGAQQKDSGARCPMMGGDRDEMGGPGMMGPGMMGPGMMGPGGMMGPSSPGPSPAPRS